MALSEGATKRAIWRGQSGASAFGLLACGECRVTYFWLEPQEQAAKHVGSMKRQSRSFALACAHGCGLTMAGTTKPTSRRLSGVVRD